MFDAMVRWSGELRDAAQAERVVQWCAWALGGSPSRYDWNQQQNWKPFEAEKLAIELVTQRSQVLRVEQGTSFAMIDTGRRGGTAVAFIRARTKPPGAAPDWRGWAASMGAQAASVTHGPTASLAGVSPDERGLGTGVWEWSTEPTWVRGSQRIEGGAWERSAWPSAAWSDGPMADAVAVLREL